MWLLSHISNGRKLYILSHKEKYSVGRNDGDLILGDDASISRQHGNIYINENGVFVEDSGSKYGTYINDDRETNKKIAEKRRIQLNVGDIVRFGRLQNIWRLERIRIKICTSTIPREQVEQLRQDLIAPLGGEIVDAWDESCTHLTMITVTVTMKVLLSLANGIPIVKPEYWLQYLNNVRTNATELPNEKDFAPPIEEPFILKENSLLQVNLNRQRLFHGKTFVFMVRRHLRQYQQIIGLAGGECVSLDEKQVRRNTLLKKEFITVQYTPSLESQSSESIVNVVDYIKEHNRRVIHESEIGLAIVHCSVERFCNPDHQMEKDFEVSSVPMSNPVGNVLASETPGTSTMSQQINARPATADELPETIELDSDGEINNNAMSKRRKISDEPKPSTSKDNRLEQKQESEIQEKAIEKSKENDVKEGKRKASETAKTPSKRQRRSDPKTVETTANEEPINNVSQNIPSQNIPPQNIPSQNIPSQNISPVSQLPERSQRASNFLRTQKLFTHTKPAVNNESQHPNEPEAVPAGQRKKRALDLLKDDSDDDNDNLFQFNKTPSKRAKQSNTSSKSRSRLGNDDDDDDNLFNFSSVPSKSRSKQAEKSQTQTTVNREDITDSVIQIQREMVAVLNVSDVQPVKRSQNGWLKRQAKIEPNEVNDTEVKSQVESSSVQIKKEPDDWELTEEEKKRKWLQSIKNAIEVRTVQLNITRRIIDEPDTTVDTTTSTKNFKAFVKKRNYTPQSIVIRTTAVDA